MFENLETEHLIIRRFSEDDWISVLKYTSDNENMKYLQENAFNEENAKEFIRQNIHENAEKFPVILKKENKLIGHMVFHTWYEPYKTWEIGWVFSKEYHNKGYATEAAVKIFNYGFETLKLHRIIATCDCRNIASYSVMEKLGMRREGHFIKDINKNGEWLDEYFYAIFEQEWAMKK